MVVSEYEEQHYPVADISGIELLKVLLEELNLQPNDLMPIFEQETILSDVFAGKQQMTINHIEKLARFFHVSPAVFLQNA